jgi:membrane-associated protein
VESFLALVTDYGVWILFAVTFLSCLAMPVPASLMMLAGGGLVASGDLSALPVAGAALSGAVLGDQTGYALARLAGGGRFAKWVGRKPARAKAMTRAHDMTGRWGNLGIFLSRWLASPLGPYVNLAAGVMRIDWPRFLFWGAMGEIVWVSAYIGMGYVFAGQVTAAAEIAGNASGFLAAAAVVIGLGAYLWKIGAEKPRRRGKGPETAARPQDH